MDGPLLLEMKQEEMAESLKLTGLQAKRLAREINALVLASSPSTPSSSSNSGHLTARSIDRLQSMKGTVKGERIEKKRTKNSADNKNRFCNWNMGRILRV